MSEGVRWDGVSFAYPSAPPSLEGVDLDVAPGDVTVVIGSSGSGKSTLLRTVNGLVPHTTGGRFGGRVTVCGQDTRDASPRSLTGVVGFVHQDPEAHFVVDHVEHDIAFVLENLAVEPAAMRRRVEEVLDALAIAHLRDRSPSTLSGGERQRCAIAGALVSAPSVLVLDEPTSELDPQGAEDVLAALGRLNADLGTTVVIAEHRLERMAPLAHRAVVMEGGRVARAGGCAEVIAGYDGAPPVTRLGRVLGWFPLPLTVRDARNHARAERRPPPAPTPAGPAGPAGRSSGDVVRAATGLEVVLGGRTVLLVDSLALHQGEVVALLGRNGSGKTTLLRTLAGLVEPRRGTVTGTGTLAYVPQDPNALLFSTTVRGELEETLRLRGQHDTGQIDTCLADFGLTELADRHPRSLSSGQRQRVAIAAIAVSGADLLLLDEPTRGIDAASGAALEAVVGRHTARGGTVVLATHDVELAARIATRTVVLGDGEVVAEGGAREVLSGSLFAPQVLRVLPPFLTVEEVQAAIAIGSGHA